MARGYMGRLLFVDLANGTLREEPLDEQLCRDFVGGYGLGARILYERMKPGVDPLGPDNILGFVTGPLAGTPALASGRYTVVAKSPLTGTWGDSNGGGDFGPHLKFAGFDAVFFTGISPKPVYLVIDSGKAELLDAAGLWGKDTQETDDILRERHGARESRVACVGPPGEKMSLLAAIINDKGRAAGRCGLGAVMGAKKLKAIVVKGRMQVPQADAEASTALRREWLSRRNTRGRIMSRYGTAYFPKGNARIGDTPTKNWTGSTPADFPHPERISGDRVIAEQERKYGCWRCPIACGGHMKAAPGRAAVSHKPEYETLGLIGSNCLNDDLDSIIRFNDLCNTQGMDTISVACTIAFAMECYENEIINRQDAGMEIRWGDGEAIVALAGKIARREGIGEVLADGAKRAAERLGRGAEEFAVHVQGEEIPAHHPVVYPGLSVSYRMDATPGHHMQGAAEWLVGDGLLDDHRSSKYQVEGSGELHQRASGMVHFINASGVCLFAYNSYPVQFIPEFIKTVTGWDYTLDDCVKIGERIGTLRHMFNLREGLNPLEFFMNPRALGSPPLEEGPLAGMSADEEGRLKEYLRVMDWDPETARPSDRKLRELGLAELV